MAAIAETIRRILVEPRRRRRTRSAEGHFRLITDEREIARSAALLAHYGNRPSVLVRQLLTDLWRMDATTLYVQVDRAVQPVELFIARHRRPQIVAAGQTFRVETNTCEPAPDGAYLVERQYRRLGFYEHPPAERVVVTLRIAAGLGHTCIVDIPHHVSHVTVVVNERVLAAAAQVPARGRMRYAAQPSVQ